MELIPTIPKAETLRSPLSGGSLAEAMTLRGANDLIWQHERVDRYQFHPTAAAHVIDTPIIVEHIAHEFTIPAKPFVTYDLELGVGDNLQLCGLARRVL